MPLTMSPQITKNNTAAYKYICKALRYFAGGGNEAGERHELNAVYQSLTGSLRRGGEAYRPLDGTYISVDRWPNYDNVSYQEQAALKAQFDADQARKVMGGNHEVDMVAGNGNSLWLVECKSGAAASNQAQMTSYVETILWMVSAAPVVGVPQHRHFFGHCRDSATQPTKENYLGEAHRFLSSIIAYAFGGNAVHIPGAHPDRFIAIKQYLGNLGYSTAANALPIDELSKILTYETTNPLPHALPVANAGGVGPMTVYGAGAPLLARFPGDDYVEKLNDVLLGRFGFGIGLVNFATITDDKVKENYRKIVSDADITVDKIAAKYIPKASGAGGS